MNNHEGPPGLNERLLNNEADKRRFVMRDGPLEGRPAGRPTAPTGCEARGGRAGGGGGAEGEERPWQGRQGEAGGDRRRRRAGDSGRQQEAGEGKGGQQETGEGKAAVEDSRRQGNTRKGNMS